MAAIRSLTAAVTYTIGLCGILPIFPWLTTFPRIVLVAGLFLGLWHEVRAGWQPKSWMQNGAIIPVFCYYALQFSRNNPVDPVVSVLSIMLALRLSGEKSVRHCLQIYALSLFCLAASSLFDLSPVFLIYLFLLLFMVALALVLLTFLNQDQGMRVTRPDFKKIVFSGLLMPILAIPLLMFFFPVMPRTQLPLWDFLTPPPVRSSGYSDSVEPGIQSSIAESRSLAFRAEMIRQSLTQQYWRGTVFNRTDGNKWTRSTQIPSEQTLFTGKKVRQEIYPEPTANRTLIALDRPLALAVQRMSKSPDGVFELWRSYGKRDSYGAESQPSGTVVQQNPINRTFYLQLPNRLSIRIKALATQITGSGRDDRTKVEQLENYFRNGDYRYTTKDLAIGDNALESFIFEKKQGHCEFFASSFALLLRVAGVPCRLVGGYLGGEYNELGGYYLVTEDKAHVWVEAYIDGSGWVRIDPSGFASNAGEIWKAPGPRSLMSQFIQAVDSFNHSWNRSVITYDFEQQMSIAGNVGSRLQAVKLSTLLPASVPYAVGGFLLAGLLFVIKRYSGFLSREQRILQSFLHTVERKFGISTGRGQIGLFEIADAVDNNQQVSAFVAIYAGAIYHDRRLTDGEYIRLRQITQDLKGMETKKS